MNGRELKGLALHILAFLEKEQVKDDDEAIFGIQIDSAGFLIQYAVKRQPPQVNNNPKPESQGGYGFDFSSLEQNLRLKKDETNE